MSSQGSVLKHVVLEETNVQHGNTQKFQGETFPQRLLPAAGLAMACIWGALSPNFRTSMS